MNRKVIVKLVDVKKWFDLRGNLLEAIFSKKGRFLKAVDGISLEIREGEIFGLVGESGCGKTTTGRLIMNLTNPTSGTITFDDVDLSTIKDKSNLKSLTLKMQMIFQDPYYYLSPWLTVQGTLAEPIRIHEMAKDKADEQKKIKEIMETVDLTPVEMLLEKYPYELSGGQRQRVVIARALLLSPKFIVADEPVSMLDVSIRVGILNLLLDMKEKYNLTSLFITHDIAIAKYMSDRIGVMYLGKLVEIGPTQTVIDEPIHPYTQALIQAVPVPDPRIKSEKPSIMGKIQSPVDLPPGCRFNPRCPYVKEMCLIKDPELIEIDKDHFVSCHHL